MKKTIIITYILAAAAVLLPACLSAQPASFNGHVVYTWAPYPNVPDTSVVRQWNNSRMHEQHSEARCGLQHTAYHSCYRYPCEESECTHSKY